MPKSAELQWWRRSGLHAAGRAQAEFVTPERPGLLIVHSGALRATGNWTYVGVMYFANKTLADGSSTERGNGKCEGQQLNSNDVLQSEGGFGVWGALVADGMACSSWLNGMQFKYDRNVFSAARSYGTVGLVQATWRDWQPAEPRIARSSDCRTRPVRHPCSRRAPPSRP